MSRQTFQASVAGRLWLWDRTLYELQLQLGTSTPQRRREILTQMEKLDSKRRAAMLKLHEIKLRERRLADARPQEARS